MNDVLDASAIQRSLGTRWLGKRIEVKAQTGSTNTDCAELARAGAPAGTVVLADWQSAGRGRRGRQWTAPPGSAVLLSAVLRPSFAAGAVGRLGMAAALAVVGAVWQVCRLAARVKYPNDVLLDGRKLAGVLPEAHLSGGRIEWAVVGIGLNVRREAVPPDADRPAVSIEEHTPPPERSRLVVALLESLEAHLDQAEADPEALAAAWRACDTVLGRQVALRFGTVRREGLAADVDADGRLLLRLADGSEEWLAPAEVSFRV